MDHAPGELLAAGSAAEVFALGPMAIKLYRGADRKRTAFREAAVHALVESFGLPVPAVHGVRAVNGRWGIVFDRIDGPSFADRLKADPTDRLTLLGGLARLQSRIHGVLAPELPGLKHRLRQNIAATDRIDPVRKAILLNDLSGMPDGDRLCHGDFHPGNVLGDSARPFVIDWPDACQGDPAADCCRSVLLLRLHHDVWAKPYLDACCRAGRLNRSQILAWLPFAAAARFAEGNPAEFGRLDDLVNPVARGRPDAVRRGTQLTAESRPAHRGGLPR